MRQILIWPDRDHQDVLCGVMRDGQWQIYQAPLTELGALDKSGDFVVILPGQNIRSFETTLPKASRMEQLKAARFAHEDKIASNLEGLHFALAPARGEEAAIISVMDEAWLEGIYEQLKAQGLGVKSMLADYDALQLLDRSIEFVGRAVYPGRTGYALDMAWADDVSPIAAQDIFDAIHEAETQGLTHNLLQGRFRPRSSFNISARPLLKFGALVACALAAYLGWQGVQTHALSLQAENLRQQSGDIYTQATGQSAPKNVARLAAQALKNPDQSNASFLQLSSLLFKGTASLENVKVDRLTYNAEAAELQLRLIYPNFEAASSLESAIQSVGGELITGGVREQGGEFVGEAVLKMRGGS